MNFENSRYSRNILLEQVGKKGQNKLLQRKVLVFGCGGLGCGLVSNLACFGIGKIGLVDCDTIEMSNLNRQFLHLPQNVGLPKTDSIENWIRNFNCDIEVENFNFKIDETINFEQFSGYDIFVDCFDNFESKFLLNKIAICLKKPLVHAGVFGFCAQVATILPLKGACLACALGENREKHNEKKQAIVSSTVTLASSIQAVEVIKVLLNLEGTLESCFLFINTLNWEIKKMRFEKNPNCPHCSALG